MVHAMLFAGGTGSRMKSETIPKQFIKVGGKPIIVRTIENFANHPMVDDIVISCIPSGIDYLNELIEEYKLTKIKAIVEGGSTGYESIHNGVMKVAEFSDEEDIILICDGVRPIMSQDLITECIKLAEQYETAVPVVKCIDSAMISTDGETCSENMSRELLYITQAPQGYTLRKILWAHDEVERRGLGSPTSSADLMVELGEEIHIFLGERNNIKVTTPEDLHALRSHYYYEQFRAFAKEELPLDIVSND